MRDGVELAVDYFVPSTTGKYPAIVEITPYGRTLNRPNFRNEAGYWINYGYAFIIADARGTGDSGGDFVYLALEGKDGYDLIEWIARQPWSMGRIGMRGASYSSGNQWYTAREKPPHLSCITPSAAPAGPMHEVPYDNGAFTLNWALTWIGLALNVKYPPAVDPHPDPQTWLNHRPLRTLDLYAIGRELALYRTFIDHPTYDDFWRVIDFTPADFEKIDIPTLAFTGWFDSTLTGTIEHYQGVSQYSPRKADHFLIVGPYSHATAVDGGYDYMTDLPVPSVGDIPVPENGLLRARDMTRQFYDWCLKDGVRPSWDPIRLFIIGSNVWITPKMFPPEEAKEVSLFLTSEGNANSIRGTGRLQWTLPEVAGSDRYVYDPMNPIFIGIDNKSYEFPVDINSILDRNDTLVYTSEKLEKSLTVVGDVVVELMFSSSARDTDLVIQLMDVMPDGRSIKLGSGFSTQLRLRYREGFEREILMTPGSNYSISINFNQIGHTFLPQHRLRLAITSSFYPWLSPNPNTGGPIGTDIQPPIVANQTIFYTSDRPSKIRLMVIHTPVSAGVLSVFKNKNCVWKYFSLFSFFYFLVMLSILG
jgi:putative CocE/NonD family hydrolase